LFAKTRYSRNIADEKKNTKKKKYVTPLTKLSGRISFVEVEKKILLTINFKKI